MPISHSKSEETSDSETTSASKKSNIGRQSFLRSSHFISENIRIPEDQEEEIAPVADDSSAKKLGREIFIGREQKSRFKSNKVSNTKYNIFTFFPKNLFEQFRRVANFYFLCIAIITFTPASPFNPAPFVAALGFIILTNMIKEIYEDILRAKEDRATNTRKVNVFSSTDHTWTEKKWQNLKVGEIVKIDCERPFPADILLLSSSFPDGECYIDTKNLDGETNLKQKQALSSTLRCREEKELAELDGVFRCEDPAAALTKFNGALRLSFMKHDIAINIEQLLIRGTILRNTDFVIGLVVYTGHETKSALNNVSPPSKRSSLEKRMNLYILFALAAEILCCLIAASIGIYFEATEVEGTFYLPNPGNLGALYVERFFTFLVLLSAMVPISLYVTLEIVRVIQARWIGWDLQMYYENDDIPAQCKTSNLNEDLGRVNYLFSDKTGTLTRNEMVFKQCSINKTIYGTLDPDVVGFKDERVKPLLKADSFEREFFICLAVCHSVLPQREEETDRVIYEASSPDELALVNGAKQTNFEFFKRTSDEIFIKVEGVEQKYELLIELPFTSDRKRMSVIVRCPDGKIRLYCKGADSIMKLRLSDSCKEYAAACFEDLDDFATIGLRTLLIASKELDEKTFAEWNLKYQKAATSLADREEEIEKVADKLERDLAVIGVSAIEDKLQVGTPETIELLLRAGIHIWVLTGDKRETAINIAKSCRLIQKQHIFQLQFDNLVEKWDSKSQDEIEEDRKLFKERLVEYHGQLDTVGPAALVITGPTIPLALDQEFKQLFLDFALKMETVVCCRVNPLQKSQMVKLVKKNTKRTITAAIGDGANDVTMIQKAHIGIGIKGKEGSQAADASDYVIGQFRFLQSLLLVHGRWSYYRLATMVMYFFYKNVSVAMINFWFSIDTRFAGQTIYDAATGLGYNLIYTALPPIFLAVFEQDLPRAALIKYPQLYKNMQRGVYFNNYVFLRWFSFGVIASVILYYVPRGAFDEGIIHQVGHNSSLWSLSAISFTSLIFVGNLRLAMEVKYWYPLLAIIIVVSTSLYLIFQFVASAILIDIFTSNIYFVWYRLIDTPVLYFSVLVSVLLTLVPDFLLTWFQVTFFPKDYDVIRERYFRLKEDIELDTLKVEAAEHQAPNTEASTKSSSLSSSSSFSSSSSANSASRLSSRSSKGRSSPSSSVSKD